MAPSEPKTKKASSTINLNKTAVENLPYTAAGYREVMDIRLTGFGVRVGPSTKTYFVFTRVKGRVTETGHYLKINKSLGRHGMIKFEDAKAKAKEILEDAAIGITPEDRQKEKDVKKQEQKADDLTLGQAFESYLEWNRQIKDSTRGNYRTHIDAYVPDWKPMQVRDLTPDMVLQRHAFLSKKVPIPPASPYKRRSQKKGAEPRQKKEKLRRNGPGVANATMKIVRLVINYLRNHKGYSGSNPVKLGKAMNKLKIRETMVSVDRLPMWFEAVQASKHPTIRDLLLFLLFTGTRSKSEAFKLKWPDIDWEGKIIYFRDTKNSTTLRLPMSGYIYELLKKRLASKAVLPSVTAPNKKPNPKSAEFVFPSDKAEAGHVTDVRKEMAKISRTAGFRISPHDLRRTFLSYANDNLGISFLTIKALVNHESDSKTTSGNADVTAGYIQVEMIQRREAIEKITNYILRKSATKEKAIDNSACLGSGI